LSITALIVAIVALIAIFLISKYKFFLLAALIANFPLLSIFTYSASQTPKHTALYLAVFSFVVSLSFLTVYLFGTNNKTANIFIAIGIWLALSVISFIILKNVKG
jgi:hypothetical protein